MGSSGSKRKGRRHLPKVGTRPAEEHELHDRREVALHPFAADPLQRGGPPYGVIAVVVAIVVALAILAFVLVS